ncbi:hypothetical protein [Flectobacillus sp. BAB-3569]|uniref:hypothetical protein n=1 Tax=Flectobacillus sp. BAB-3569 TaxID=1509483 RepID=UPI000BA3241F|nr:hypothetical protein [Flectobacillus sp. BAB-3569]PAC28760.1 hypothetical protein BWI92_19515 [Flectobacillus sp. BAB-3569]
MTTLPQNIKEQFFKAIKGDLSLREFEEWLYTDKELERLLNSESHFELIAINFREGGAKYELWKFLKNYIGLQEFEKYKMLELLNEAKQKTERLPYILMEFYNLYCYGYNFLQDLGLGIGLAVEVPRVNNTIAETWNELTSEQQTALSNSFSPELEYCIEQVINWINTDKIILTGEQDELGHYEYQDLRTEEEKKSKLWVIVSEDNKTGFSTSKNLLWEKLKDRK